MVISAGPHSFGPLTESFWQETLRFGFMTPRALWRLERRARELDDLETLNKAVTPDGLSGPVRDWLYALRFPSLFFGNLVNGEIFLRYDENLMRLDEIVRARGFIPYPELPNNDLVGPEANLPRFVRTKLKTDYFEKTLRVLRDNGLPVALLVMPIKSATRGAMATAVETEYIGYLQSQTRQFPNVRLVNSHIPGWPDTQFADDVHLNPTGAQRFSDRLAACVEASAIRAECDLDWNASAAEAATPAPLKTSLR